MCGGVYYHYEGQEVRTYFPNPKAFLLLSSTPRNELK